MRALEEQGGGDCTWAVHSDDDRFDAWVITSRDKLIAHHCAGNLLHPAHSQS